MHTILRSPRGIVHQPAFHCDRCGDVTIPAYFDTPEAADDFAAELGARHDAGHQRDDQVAADPFHGLT